MKLLIISLKMIWEDKWKLLLMALQIFIFIYTLNISYGTIQYLSKLNNLVRQTGISEAAYFSLNNILDYQQYKLNRNGRIDNHETTTENKLISQLNGIIANDLEGFAQELSISELKVFDRESKKQTVIEVYNGKTVKYKLAKGKWFSDDEANKVVISNDLSSIYKVGDKIPISVSDRYGKQHEITIEVTGVLLDDYILTFNAGGNSLSLSSIFSPAKNLVIAGKLVGNNGIITGQDSMGRLLLPERDRYSQEIFSEWQQKLSLYGNITPIEVMAKRTEESNKSRLLQQIAIEFIIFLLAVSGIGANNFLMMLTRKREFSVYFLCGLKFKSCILLGMLKNLFTIAIPSIAAFIVIKLQSASDGYFTAIIDLNNFFMCLLVIFLIYLLTAIPVYRKMSILSPVELFREE